MEGSKQVDRALISSKAKTVRPYFGGVVAASNPQSAPYTKVNLHSQCRTEQVLGRRCDRHLGL